MPRIESAQPLVIARRESGLAPSTDRTSAARRPRNREVMAVKSLEDLRRLQPNEQAEFIEFGLMGNATGIQGGAGRFFLHVRYEGEEMRRGGIDYEPKAFDRNRVVLPEQVRSALAAIGRQVAAQITGSTLQSASAAGLINIVGDRVERWGFKLQTGLGMPDGSRAFATNYADGEGSLLPKPV